MSSNMKLADYINSLGEEDYWKFVIQCARTRAAASMREANWDENVYEKRLQALLIERQVPVKYWIEVEK